MFKMKSLLASTGLIAGLCQATFASPSFIQAGIIDSRYIDFSTTSPHSNHATWQTWTPPNGGSPVKYMTLQLAGTNPGVPGSCFQVHVSPASGTPQQWTDLRLWPAWGSTSIDDDGPNNSRMPYAKIWMGSTTGNFILAAKNSTQNQIDFRLSISTLQSVTTAAGCDDGVSPFHNFNTGVTLRANTTSN